VVPLGQDPVHVDRAVAGLLGGLLQVGTAGKGTPGAGDQDRPDPGILGDLLDRREQVEGELIAPGVHPLGAVQLDFCPRTATV
jgi:hypothetical protein